MKPWLVFDTEDDSEECLASGRSGFEKKITQISAKTHDGKTYYSHGDVDGFRKWLSRFNGIQAWYHAGGRAYDLGALFADTLDVLDLTLVGQRLVRARWRGVEFLDSHNLYPAPLSEIGESFGLKKLKRDANSKTYVLRDVAILHEAIDFASRVAQENGVELGATAGSLALKIWRQLGGANWQDGFFESREAYIGGRAELFCAQGSGRIVKSDINSLYPWALTQNFPEPLEKCNDIKTYGIISARVEQIETDLAVLPVRQWDGSVLYPEGSFCGVWTMHELRAAIDRGAIIKKIFGAWGTDRGHPYYADFAKRFFSKKSSENDCPAKRSFFKTMLNSFVGQIASTGKISRSVDLTSHPDLDGVPYGTKKLVDLQTPIGKHVNYCHAAHINSYSRLKLLEYLELIGSENLIYCKTDCVIFFCEKELPFIPGDGLGEMRIETDEITDFICHEIDIYRLGAKRIAKGVPRRVAGNYVDHGSASYEIPFGLREAIHHFNAHNRKKLGIWRKVGKNRNSRYSKKDINANGRYFPKTVNFKKYYSRLETEKACVYDHFQDY